MIAIPIVLGYFAVWILTAALLHRFMAPYDDAFGDVAPCVMIGFLWPGVVGLAVTLGLGWAVGRVVRAVS